MLKHTSTHHDPPAESNNSAGGTLPALLEMRGISKKFPGVLALDNVDFDLRHSEVHVLFGENGAGKSTLINIIAGTFSAESGVMKYSGEDIKNLTPHKARHLGISPVFQEFSLVPHLTVQENLFLGHELSKAGFLNKQAMKTRANDVIARLGFDLHPNDRVSSLSRAHQQMVEIAKALLADVKLLILDEPTASLTEAETTRLFELIETLKAEGAGIIYVSHRMKEIKQVADRISILRDGQWIAECDAKTVEEGELVELMTGRKVDMLFPKIDHAPTVAKLEMRNIKLANGSVNGGTIVAHAGEITGIAGLVGCGKSELIRTAFGLEKIESGTLVVSGEAYEKPTPSKSLKRGICYFPSDRVVEGLALDRPIRENASVAALDQPEFVKMNILRRAQERRVVQNIVDRLKLRPPNIERAVGNLSGGNMQKVMLSRGLTRETDIFLFDEPTVGIDVGAKIEVYELMKSLTESGAAVILVTSELPEALHLSNRLYVMHRAKIVAELTGDGISEQAVLSHFFKDTDHAQEKLPRGGS